MRVSAALLALGLSQTAPPSTHAFHFAGWNLSRPSSLYAKAAKRKKKKNAPSSSAAGGFGAKKEGLPKEDDDYAAFPALEPQVKETIVPLPDDMKDNNQGLPMEIYDRLDQIYGFRDFNYPSGQNDEDDDEPASLGDLLASPSSKETKSDLVDEPLNFANLLETSEDDAGTTAEPKDLPLSSVPPFSDFRVLHVDPLVLAIDNFFTDEECDRYISMSEAPASSSVMTRSKTVGKDRLSKAQRTSTTWFHHFNEVPELMAKASRLLGLEGIDHWEEPQTVRYRRNEKFTWHLDALAPSEDLESLGGQRTATLLVYLTGLSDTDGGATMFRDLSGSNGRLAVRPTKGSALLFFPAAGGVPNVPFDIRTLHCGEVVAKDASQDKWIGQLWLRKGTYKPTAPPGNSHEAAYDAISNYCTSSN